MIATSLTDRATSLMTSASTGRGEASTPSSTFAPLTGGSVQKKPGCQQHAGHLDDEHLQLASA